MNWETVEPTVVGSARLRLRARRRARLRKIAWPHRPLVAFEARDFYDAIEWAGAQSWSSGRVGACGISYYAMTQWLVASLKPPSLAAMISVGGRGRHVPRFRLPRRHLLVRFATNWWNNHMAHHLLGKPQGTATDAFSTPWLWEYMHHRPRWRLVAWPSPRWDNIDIPLYSAATGAAMGLHLRGNTEGFTAGRVGAQEAAHSRRDALPPRSYSAEGRGDQLRFLDHWLKGEDTGIMEEPPVKLLIAGAATATPAGGMNTSGRSRARAGPGW